MNITPLKIQMMLHYTNVVVPFEPDHAALPMGADVDMKRAELVVHKLLRASDAGIQRD